MTHIRNFTKNDISFAVSLAHTEGWYSETEDEFNGFLTYHPEGCFIIEVNGNRAGMCVTVPYEQDGYFSEFIIAKNYRGKNIGSKLLNHAVHHLTNIGINNIYLDGMPKATALYEKAGFRKIGLSTRWKGTIHYNPSSEVHPISESDLKRIIETDKKIFKCDRSFFLKYLWQKNQATSKILKRNNRIIGYIFGKIRDPEFSIGPWVCLGNETDALLLLQGISKKLSEYYVRIGVYDTNHKSITLLKETGLMRQPDCPWHMVRGKDTKLGDSKNIYGIGSAAKG